MDTHFCWCCGSFGWLVCGVGFVWRQGLDMPEGAIRSRASEPLERQVELLKTTGFVATALVPFAAKVSVVPCCSVRFGTAEREQAELAL